MLAVTPVTPGTVWATLGSNPTGFTDVNGTVFFAATNSAGTGLFKTGGTAATTSAVRMFGTNASSGPLALTPSGNTLYFAADGGMGRELWKSDGTDAGTVLVKDIRPNGSSSPGNLVPAPDGSLYFTANDGVNGAELWRTDGTESGTGRLSDANPGSASGAGFDVDPTFVGQTLYFIGQNSQLGTGIYRTDGTAAGTVRFFSPSPAGAQVKALTSVGGTLYFTVNDQLWKTDGTVANTVKVKNGINATHLVALGEALLFASVDSTTGNELWKTDGTDVGTLLVKDINPGTGWSIVGPSLARVGSQVFFLAREVNGGPLTLFRTDGTADGTVKLPAVNATNATAAGGRLYFTSTDPAAGSELWVSDGTVAGTGRVVDPSAGPKDWAPASLAAAGDGVYFSADDGLRGREPYRTDGTAAGTRPITDLNTTPAPGSPSTLAKFKGEVYFAAPGGLYKTDGTAGNSTRLAPVTPKHFAVLGDVLYFTDTEASAGLWKTDGTPGGTTLVQKFPLPAPFVSSINNLTVFKGNLYFSTRTGAQTSTVLWKSDGTAAGTVPLQPGATWPALAVDPRSLTPVGDLMFFYGYDGQNGLELWKTDGTAAGTVMVEDIYAGGFGSMPIDPPVLVNVNGRLVFGAATDPSGYEPWVSDGTEAETFMLRDLWTEPRFGGLRGGPYTAGGLGWFFGTGTNGSLALYKTDGTPAGTVQVKVIRDDPAGAVDFGGKLLFFTRPPGGNDYSLWISDGTEVGTVMVRTLRAPGANVGDGPGPLVVSGNLAYFAAADALDGTGRELWHTDGTNAGTQPVADLKPGSDGSAPADLLDVNGTLYFTAVDTSGFRQVFKATAPTAPPAAPADLVATPASPFRVNLTWRDASDDESAFRIERSDTADFARVDAVFTTAANTTAYTDALAEPERTYFYRVSAFNVAGRSAPVGASATTPEVTRPAYGAVDPTHEYYVPYDQNSPPLVGYRGRVYLNAYTYEGGWFAARSDGETITPLPPGAGFVPVEAAGTGFYVYNDGLWRTDGVPGDAVLLHQFNRGQAPRFLTPFGDLLLFTAGDARGLEPWVSDGTVAGTRLLKDIFPPNGAGFPTAPGGYTVLGDAAYFYASDGVHGYELWKTDGTESGTALVKDIQEGTEGSLPNSTSGFEGEMMVLGSALYFRALGPGSRPGVGVWALFKTDGTEAGTTVVAGNRMAREITPLGDKFYFLGDATNGYGLYASDGTPGGTQLVKFIPATRFYPRDLTVAGGRMFFEDGVNLWVSDGTAGGTRVLRNFGALNDPTVEGLTEVADKVCFRGGEKLWVSDGTTAGTVRVPDPTSGLIPGAPRQLVNVDNVLFFTAKVQGVIDRPERLWRLAPVLPAIPAAPSDVAGTVVSAEQVDVTWADNSANETGFLVERSGSPAFDSIDWSAAAPTGATRATDRTVIRGGTYYYRVRAFNAGGRSPAAMSGAVVVPLTPLAPTGLSAVAVDAANVNLSWTDASDDETGFIIERSTRSNFAAIDKTVTLPAGSTAYADGGLTRLTTYYYRVVAVNDLGRSAAATASVTTPEAVPAAPSDLVAFPVSATQVDLQWRDNSPNETAFVIERADGNGTFAQIAELPAGRTYYSDAGRTGGSGVYHYRVLAKNVAGASAYTPVATATALPPELTTPVVRLPDLPPLGIPTDANPTEVVMVGNTGFFLATNAAAGTRKELWRTAGTAAGTSLVKVLDTVGSPSSIVNNLTGAGGLFYFLRTDAGAVTRLWRSDGTDAGTFPVRDLFTNFEPGDPFANRFRVGRFTAQDGKLYYEVWELDQPRGVFRSDGTAAGTAETNDPVTWPDTSGVTIGDAYYYGSNSGVYKRVGPPGGQEVLLKSLPPGGQFMGIIRVGDRVAFTTKEYDTAGEPVYSAVYVTDGTEAGTTRLAKITTAGDLGVREMEAVGDGTLYFAFVGEIWMSNLTPQGTAKLLNHSGIGLPHLSAVNGLLTYSMGQVFASDGTEAGTARITSIGTRNSPAHPDWFATAGGKVYFTSSPFEFDPYGWRVGGGRELYLTDGTAEGTVKLFTGDVRHPVDFDGTLYFVSTDAQGRDVIYRTDGTAAGTVALKAFEQPVRLLKNAVAGNTMYFAVGHPGNPSIMGVWKTDGTAQGTAEVTPHRMSMLYENGYGQEEYAVAGGRFYFAGESGELFATDGTAAGTVRVANVFTSPLRLTNLGGTLYFAGRAGAVEGLWLYRVSPGASSATRIIKVTDYVDAGMGEMVAVNGVLYYTVPDYARGYEIWRSDGTAAGTRIVTDVMPGEDPYAMQNVFWLTDVGGTIYFLTREQQSDDGMFQSGGLFKTDGTAAGTVRIRDITLDVARAPLFMTAVAGKAVFSDGKHLWRSDGTAPGTVQIDRIGEASDGTKSPAFFVGDAYAVAGDKLFYPGTVPGGGRDLRVASLTPPEAPGALTVSSAAAPAVAPAAAGPAAIAAAGVTLTWQDNSANESAFAIERSRSADFAALDGIFFVSAGVTQFVDASATPGGTYFYRVRAVNAGGGSGYSNRAGNVGGVVSRSVFYNGSSYDGYNRAAEAADDGAIAIDKVALLPGRPASFANVTSYVHGLNGIMIDLLGLRTDLSSDDFVFRVGPGDGTWSDAPQPLSVTRRPGAGVGGSDRVTVIWADGIIVNRWLQVTLLANGRTGLAAADVFCFGNLSGESGDGFGGLKVNALDIAAVKRNLSTSTVPISSACDFNRDGRVNALDVAAVKRNLTRSLALPVPVAMFADEDPIRPVEDLGLLG